MAEAPPCPPRSWSGIPPELAGQVLALLPTLVDRVRFAAVCIQWRAAARQLPLPLPPLPLLAIEDDGTFYCLPRTDRYRFPGCAGGAFHSICSGNWLVLPRNDAAIFLVDPFSKPKATMKLPQFSGEHDGDKLFSAGAKLVLCSPHLVAAVIGVPLPPSTKIAVCQPQGSTWSVHSDDQCRNIVDIEFHQGKLYALDEYENLFAIEVGEYDSAVQPSISQVCQVIKASPLSRSGDTDTLLYLVESNAELLMVRRTTYYEDKPYMLNGERVKVSAAGSCEFHLFKADFGQSLWAEATMGDNQALFLGRRCSRAVDVSHYAKFGNHIFFLDDDYGEIYWYKAKKKISFRTYNMKNGNVSIPLPRLSWKYGTASGAWLFPCN